MSAKTNLLILLLAIILAITASASDWQGQGAMNQTVIAKIWESINAVNIANVPYSTTAKTISDSLNNEWDPAWNVIVVQNVPGKDTILYGYAFRNQWMWYNGVPLPGYDMYRITFIVWKDYNCKDWKTLVNIASGFTAQQLQTIEDEIAKITEAQLNNDIWGTAHNFMETLMTKTGFNSPDNAYTIIMSQYGGSSINGYVCRVGDNFYNSGRTHYGGIVSGLGNL